MNKRKTSRECVDECNALARQFYASMGYEVEEGYRFDRAHHPQEQGMWNMAAMAYEHIDGTEMDQVLLELEDESDDQA